jgi:galactokinase/mevalonate kinase-like predicted kinase
MSEMIVSRTPLRITFLGGGTDLNPYRDEKGGVCIAATIDKYVNIFVADNFEKKIRASYSSTEIVDNSDEIRHPLVRNALKLLRIEAIMEQQNKGIEILSKSDIPSKGTGMGSSSSFTVGLLNALHVWKDSRMVSEDQLAREAVQIETRAALEDAVVKTSKDTNGQNMVNSINDISSTLKERMRTLEQKEAILWRFSDLLAKEALKEKKENAAGTITLEIHKEQGAALLEVLKEEKVDTGMDRTLYQAIKIGLLDTAEPKGLRMMNIMCEREELKERIREIDVLRARLSGRRNDAKESLQRLERAYDASVSDHDFTITLLRELYLMKDGVMLPQSQLDKKTKEAEGNISVGRQDQYIAAFGGMQLMQFMPGGRAIMTQIPLALEEMKKLKEHFLLLYTGVQRNASDQLLAQKKEAKGKYPLYDRMKELTNEFATELKDGVWRHVGEFLDKGWQIKKQLSNGISNGDIDGLYERAKKAGAVGAKLLGAGGGGFLLIYAPPDVHESILASLPELKPVNFNLTMEGSKVRVLHEGGV